MYTYLNRVGRAAIALALILSGGALYRLYIGYESTFEQVLSGTEAVPKYFDEQDFVSLSRTACFGSCPVYTVKIFGSGRVEFNGERFTCAEGLALSQIPRASAQRLLYAIVESGFTTLPDYDRQDATDAPGATVLLSLGSYSHRVYHYHGMMFVPGVVSAIERKIDALATTSQWLPIDRDGSSFCRLPDGTEQDFFFGIGDGI